MQVSEAKAGSRNLLFRGVRGVMGERLRLMRRTILLLAHLFLLSVENLLVA